MCVCVCLYTPNKQQRTNASSILIHRPGKPSHRRDLWSLELGVPSTITVRRGPKKVWFVVTFAPHRTWSSCRSIIKFDNDSGWFPGGKGSQNGQKGELELTISLREKVVKKVPPSVSHVQLSSSLAVLGNVSL